MTDIQNTLRKLELKLDVLQDLHINLDIKNAQNAEQIQHLLDNASNSDIDERLNALESSSNFDVENISLLCDRVDNLGKTLNSDRVQIEERLEAFENRIESYDKYNTDQIRSLFDRLDKLEKAMEFDEAKQSKVCIDLTNIEATKRQVIESQNSVILANKSKINDLHREFDELSMEYEAKLKELKSKIGANTLKLDGLQKSYAIKKLEFEKLTDTYRDKQNLVMHQVSELASLLSDMPSTFYEAVAPTEWERRIINFVKDMGVRM